MSDATVDDDLLVRAIAGDVLAFEQVLLQYFSTLERYIAAKIPPSAQRQLSAEDVLQEAFTQAFQDIGEVTATSAQSLLAWLKSIADHRLLDALKRMHRAKRGGRNHQLTSAENKSGRTIATLIDAICQDAHLPDKSAARHEAERAIRIAVAALPGLQRQVICGRYFSGKSIDVIATEIGRTPAAVRGLIQRAKESLRATMGHSSQWVSRR